MRGAEQQPVKQRETGDEEGEEETGDGAVQKVVPFIQSGFGVVLFLLAMGVLGFMEMRSMCTGRSTQIAISNAQSVEDCTAPNPTAGDILFFSCPVSQATVPTWSEADFDTNILPNDTTWQGMGAKKQVRFFGCLETKTRNRRRSVTYRYSYSKQWLDANTFEVPTDCTRAEPTCGADACLEPSGMYGTEYKQEWGSALKAGFFDITGDILSTSLGLETTLAEEGYSVASCETNPTLGCEKVEFSGQTADVVSFLGAAADGSGGLTGITVPDNFACEAESYSQLIGSDATMTKEAVGNMLLNLNAENRWLVRGLFTVMAIVAVFLCLFPIATAADIMGACLRNIPGLGGCLVDSFDGVAGTVLGCIAVAVGAGSSLLVIGFFELFVTPVLGGSMLAVFLCCCCAAVAVRKSAGAPNKKQNLGGDGGGEKDGAQMTQGDQTGMQMPGDFQAPMQQPMMQQPYTIEVPAGAMPGASVPFQTVDGRQLQAQVPAGMAPGMIFQVVA